MKKENLKKTMVALDAIYNQMEETGRVDYAMLAIVNLQKALTHEYMAIEKGEKEEAEKEADPFEQAVKQLGGE